MIFRENIFLKKILLVFFTTIFLTISLGAEEESDDIKSEIQKIGNVLFCFVKHMISYRISEWVTISSKRENLK